MAYDPKIHHRRSIRLKGYDYSRVGAYFVTICTHKRECVFGEVVEGEMRLNETGMIVQDEWLRTPTIRPNVELDVFVVMPDHLQGIIILNDDGRGESQFAPTRFHSPSGTVGAIVRGFKSASTKRINEIRGAIGRPLWQRNFHDRIIRDENEMRRTQEYIVNNPLQWYYDEERTDEQNAASDQGFA